ncbi:ABC transporter ATP-binding protein [Clostridium rectalis]|uniref:ABC transporter ATP-binding protein n=1 Tax=Clostridium rectalis TaxID=2040295 RepID=UPI000F6337DB|nr:ABC transporter ATP-binding protein [Clostridium rectalis]
MNISVKDLYVKIGHKTIVENVGIDVGNREFVGIIGPNGSGKSTLLKTIYRALKPYCGTIKIDNTLIENMPLKESAKKLGVMTQASSFNFDFTVQEVVMMGRTPHKKMMEPDDEKDYEIVYKSLEMVGMYNLMNRKFNSLSGGEKQRVLIARALSCEPKALVLDEPTNHLDIYYQISLLDIVKNLNVEIFSAIHDLNLAATYCDKIYVMQKGSIVKYGTPKEVFTSELLKKVFNVNAIIEENNKTNKINIIYTGV